MKNPALSKLLRLELTKFSTLVDRYLVTQGMTPQQIFDNFIAQEESERPEFTRRALSATTSTKRQYWFNRASGLTTKGGNTRLKKLLTLAVPPQKEELAT